MSGRAFCPAHVTGFFKVQNGPTREETGSIGAGFSIRAGVTSAVSSGRGKGHHITIEGYQTQDTAVSDHVVREFRKFGHAGLIDIIHRVDVPVGYGLGCSGAVALSLALALNEELDANLTRAQVGKIAHSAEISCRTGLGDVLGAYHGGFEIRTRAGAPGVGAVQTCSGDANAVLFCFAPVSTPKFLAEKIQKINGLGGRMVGRLLENTDMGAFQDMSMEFADYLGVVTPRMRALSKDLRDAGFGCGIALFGETVFCLGDDVEEAARIGEGRGAITIRSGIDQRGARVL